MGYTHYFLLLTNHIETLVRAGGYPLLFLSVFLEGIPIIGAIIPGHVAVLVAGFLVKIGVFGLWITIFLSVTAAVLGDYVGYALGRKYGLPLIDRLKPYFFITDNHIAKTQELLHNHTGKAMIMGRLSPVTRALMPFLVGANHTPIKKFWTYNVIGGLVWAVGSIVVGYAFGAGYQAATGFLSQFILLAIIATVLILWGYRFVNLRFHVFRRYELFSLILNLASLWTLAKVIQDTWSLHPTFANFDVWTNLLMMCVTGNATSAWASYCAAYPVMPVLVSVATWIGAFGDIQVLSALAVILTGWFLYRRRWRSGLIMFFSVLSTLALVGFMKEFFQQARPSNALQLWTDPSFPSGHAAVAAAAFLVIAYIFGPRIRSWVLRELYIVLCLAAIIVVGLSRLVLNVHWASDVIAGWALGIFCATSSILLVRYVGTIVMGKAHSMDGISQQQRASRQE